MNRYRLVNTFKAGRTDPVREAEAGNRLWGWFGAPWVGYVAGLLTVVPMLCCCMAYFLFPIAGMGAVMLLLYTGLRLTREASFAVCLGLGASTLMMTVPLWTLMEDIWLWMHAKVPQHGSRLVIDLNWSWAPYWAVGCAMAIAVMLVYIRNGARLIQWVFGVSLVLAGVFFCGWMAALLGMLSAFPKSQWVGVYCMTSLGYLIMVAAGAWWVMWDMKRKFWRQARVRIKAARDLCPRCGYDITGNAKAGVDLCPECGAQLTLKQVLPWRDVAALKGR